MNSTRIGDIGVANVIARCMSKNIPVYVPFSDNEKADLIILLNNVPKKIQVKTTLSDKNGVSVFHTSSCTSKIYNRKSVTHYYSNDEVDYYMLYNVNRDEVYLIPFNECKGGSVTLRHVPTKNNQQKGIKLSTDYIF